MGWVRGIVNLLAQSAKKLLWIGNLLKIAFYQKHLGFWKFPTFNIKKKRNKAVKNKVLITGNDEDLRSTVCFILEREGYEVAGYAYTLEQVLPLTCSLSTPICPPCFRIISLEMNSLNPRRNIVRRVHLRGYSVQQMRDFLPCDTGPLSMLETLMWYKSRSSITTDLSVSPPVIPRPCLWSKLPASAFWNVDLLHQLVDHHNVNSNGGPRHPAPYRTSCWMPVASGLLF